MTERNIIHIISSRYCMLVDYRVHLIGVASSGAVSQGLFLLFLCRYNHLKSVILANKRNKYLFSYRNGRFSIKLAIIHWWSVTCPGLIPINSFQLNIFLTQPNIILYPHLGISSCLFPWRSNLFMLLVSRFLDFPSQKINAKH